jgi:hypothetical protein
MTRKRILQSLPVLWFLTLPFAAGTALADDFDGSSLDESKALTAGITDSYKFLLDFISLQKGPALTLSFSPVTTFARSETFSELYRLHQESALNWRRFAVSATVAPLDGEGDLATELGTWSVGVQWPIVDTTGLFYGEKSRTIETEMLRELDDLTAKAAPLVSSDVSSEMAKDITAMLEKHLDETCLGALPDSDAVTPPAVLQSPWTAAEWSAIIAPAEGSKERAELERILRMAQYGCTTGNLASIDGARRSLVALVRAMMASPAQLDCTNPRPEHLTAYTDRFPGLAAKWKAGEWSTTLINKCTAKENALRQEAHQARQTKIAPLVDAARNGAIIALGLNYLSEATVETDTMGAPSVERSRSWTADMKASYRWYWPRWAFDVTAAPFSVIKVDSERQVVLEHKAAVTGELLREQLNGGSILQSLEASFQTNAPDAIRKETALRSRTAFPLGNGVYLVVSLSGTKVEASGWERDTSLSIAWSHESGGKTTLRSIDFAR